MNQAKAYSLEEAQKKLEYFCAYQERCHQEVTQKLTQMKMIPQAREHIIAYLIEENYLNETRFAQSFARGKFRIKKWGKQRIVRELKARNISSFNITLALKEIQESAYADTLQSLAKKYWDTHIDKPLLLRKKKVLQALQYRGWETTLIYETIQQLEVHTQGK